MMAGTYTAVPKNKQQSVIRVLMIENVSGSEIRARICVVYGTENIITKSTVNWWVERFTLGWTRTSDKLRMTYFFKKDLVLRFLEHKKVGWIQMQLAMYDVKELREELKCKIRLTRQWPYHCLTDRVIFFSIRFLTQSASDHTTVSQTGFFVFFFSNTFLTLNVSDHTTVS